MKTNHLWFIALCCSTAVAISLVLFTANRWRTPANACLPGDVVARVANQNISLVAMEQELARRHVARPTEADKAAALDDLVRLDVLYANACKAGYDRRPDVQAAVKRLIVAHYRDSLETNRPTPGRVSDEEIAAYYRRHADRFGTPEQIRAAVIFLPLSARAEPERKAAVRQQAEVIRSEALAKASNEASFGLLAQTNSAHQASRYKGGDLGWLTQAAFAKEWDTTLAGAVYALTQRGAISPILEGKEGLYLFKLMGRKPAAVKPLTEVREGVAYHLAREQAEQQEARTFAQLKEQVPIQINQAALARLRTDAPPATTPPALPSE